MTELEFRKFLIEAESTEEEERTRKHNMALDREHFIGRLVDGPYIYDLDRSESCATIDIGGWISSVRVYKKRIREIDASFRIEDSRATQIIANTMKTIAEYKKMNVPWNSMDKRSVKYLDMPREFWDMIHATKILCAV